MAEGKVVKVFVDRYTRKVYRPGQDYTCEDQGRLEQLAGMGLVEVSGEVAATVEERPDDADPGEQISGETVDGDDLPPASEPEPKRKKKG